MIKREEYSGIAGSYSLCGLDTHQQGIFSLASHLYENEADTFGPKAALKSKHRETF